jgi:hypothetical protein
MLRRPIFLVLMLTFVLGLVLAFVLLSNVSKSLIVLENDEEVNALELKVDKKYFFNFENASENEDNISWMFVFGKDTTWYREDIPEKRFPLEGTCKVYAFEDLKKVVDDSVKIVRGYHASIRYADSDIYKVGDLVEFESSSYLPDGNFKSRWRVDGADRGDTTFFELYLEKARDYTVELEQIGEDEYTYRDEVVIRVMEPTEKPKPKPKPRPKKKKKKVVTPPKDDGKKDVKVVEVVEVPGCTDRYACNYKTKADVDDGSCRYPDPYKDCSGKCLNDSDGDGICDELEPKTDDNPGVAFNDRRMSLYGYDQAMPAGIKAETAMSCGLKYESSDTYSIIIKPHKEVAIESISLISNELDTRFEYQLECVSCTDIDEDYRMWPAFPKRLDLSRSDNITKFELHSMWGMLPGKEYRFILKLKKGSIGTVDAGSCSKHTVDSNVMTVEFEGQRTCLFDIQFKYVE